MPRLSRAAHQAVGHGQGGVTLGLIVGSQPADEEQPARQRHEEDEHEDCGCRRDRMAPDPCPHLLQAAAGGRRPPRSPRTSTLRASTPSAMFAAASPAASGRSATPIVPDTKSTTAQATATTNTAHRRPITSPTSSNLGITHEVFRHVLANDARRSAIVCP